MPSVIRGSDNFDTAGGNAVKAWVNFNGTGTVAIRASYNVSSITDNGVGQYTVNMASALNDVNYSMIGSCGNASNNTTIFSSPGSAPTTSAFQVLTMAQSGANTDYPYVSVVALR